MIVKFKQLNEDAVLPQYAKPGDAGKDLVATSKKFSTEKQCWIYGTGLAVEIPEGFVGLLFPRSSVRNYCLILANCVGVIDSGYRGEIMCSFKPYSFGNNKIYNVGDKIAQLIIVPVPMYESEWSQTLSDTERGTGGHGSTGI